MNSMPFTGSPPMPTAVRLAKSFLRRLKHCLIGKRAGSRNNADRPLLEDIPGHDADLAFLGRQNAGAIRADEPRGGAVERLFHPHHVEHRNALGDAHGERYLRIDCLQYSVRRKGRRHIDRGCFCPGGFARLGHRVEHRQAEMGAAAFAGRHPADHLRAIGDCLLACGKLPWAPVMPWQITSVFLPTNMAISAPFDSRDDLFRRIVEVRAQR